MMQEEDAYISRLLEKLSTVEDKELIGLVRKLIEERNYLSQIANIDTLTGLNNRRVLGRIRDFGSILMCDIDNFKAINDNYGHDIGDMAIKGVGQILQESVRTADYVCRFGGDEFIIIFSNSCTEEVVKERAEEIRQKVKDKLRLGDHQITLSMGVAKREAEEKIEDVMKKADAALYASKSAGKDRISVYEQTHEKRL